MPRILDAIEQFFKEDDWNYQLAEKEDETYIMLGFEGKTARWTCYARALESQDQFAFYSMCPLKCPEERLSEMAEFVCRANYGMMIGNFELDFRDGEIRYKTTVDIGDGPLTADLIKPLVYANCLMMDRYLSGIMGVLQGNQSAYEACMMAEAGEPEISDNDDDDGDDTVH